MERFIFDLDGTLLFSNYDKEQIYFRKHLKENADIFLGQMTTFLDEYENTHARYEIEKLASFLSEKTNISFTKEFIQGWIDTNCEVEDEIEKGAKETLAYLKMKKKSVVILTNWFFKTQYKRIERSGLLPYIDDIYAGNYFLKPHKESYFHAMGKFPIEDCVIIGDSYEKDFLVPRKLGIYSILYDRNQEKKESTEVIHTLEKIKERCEGGRL